jgi:hypothetical protein
MFSSNSSGYWLLEGFSKGELILKDGLMCCMVSGLRSEKLFWFLDMMRDEFCDLNCGSGKPW